jgi:hypothetical protein
MEMYAEYWIYNFVYEIDCKYFNKIFGRDLSFQCIKELDNVLVALSQNNKNIVSPVLSL